MWENWGEVIVPSTGAKILTGSTALISKATASETGCLIVCHAMSRKPNISWRMQAYAAPYCWDATRRSMSSWGMESPVW